MTPRDETPSPAPEAGDPDEPTEEPEADLPAELPALVPAADSAPLDTEGLPLVAEADAIVGEVIEEPIELSEGGAVVPTDALSRYLAEIRRYPVLDRDEEHRLAVAYREDGDPDAAFRLLASNLRLVVMIAREYQRSLRNLLDLIQEGNVGLMEALKRYDPYRGVRFPSYAVWWIRAYMIRYVLNNFRLVKIGTTQAQRKLFFNLNQEKQRLERMGIHPGPALLAERLDVEEREITEMEQRLSTPEISTETPLGDDGNNTLLGVLAAQGTPADELLADEEYRSAAMQAIHAFAAGLDGKEKIIFEERLLNENPATLETLGKRFGVTRERVRQLEKRLLDRMRVSLEKELAGFRGPA
ncbi:MAG: RNA polymerase factor sigma-32 [Deltaproteobacteria bacterium]|nr:RNA polymerase factor sigma-32 [Deltaproteobacteria bacterium]